MRTESFGASCGDHVVTRTHITSKRRLQVLTLICSTALAILILELGARWILPPELMGLARPDQALTAFAYDAELGWFPIPNHHGPVHASRQITDDQNSMGFRDSELTPSERPTLLFVGDSFVWGFDVEQRERFTDLLGQRLPLWNVHNIGVSGYGTDQELLLLERLGAKFDPSFVFLVFCAGNDRRDNTSNETDGGLYKPYFVLDHGELRVHGTPVPEAVDFAPDLGPLDDLHLVRLFELYRGRNRALVHVQRDPTNALIGEVRRYVEEVLGARFAMGLTASDPRLERYCRDEGIDCLDLTSSLRYPGFGHHWTPAGHRLVAARLQRYFESLPAPEPVAHHHS